MKRLSLRWLLVLAFICLSLALMAAYSWLSAYYFMRGLDSATLLTLEQHIQVASAAKKSVPTDAADDQLPQRLSIAFQWSDMPESVRQLWPQPPLQVGQLLKARAGDVRADGPPARMVFLLREQLQDGSPVYASLIFDSPHESARVIENHQQNRTLLFAMAIALMCAVGLGIMVVIRGVFNPLARLQQWTDGLTPEQLDKPIPDFYYPELNTLAELIRSSLITVQHSVEREQRFLHHASHELRTPISVVRSNIVLALRLLEQQRSAETALQRIDRASRTMKDLTETLLWLGRTQAEQLPHSNIELADEIRYWCGELEYLLHNKPIELSLQTQPGQYDLPLTAVRIAVSNLIRNAIQHTWQGNIRIQQQGLAVVIENTGELAADEHSSTGYGLGIELVRQLCDKMHWHYRVSQTDDCYRTELQLKQRNVNAEQDVDASD